MRSKMSGKTDISKRTTPYGDSLIGQLVDSLILARAAALARKGELKTAETLLMPLASNPEATTNILDLLAKVYAQQWKIAEAQSLWLRALNIEPSNKHFLRALIRCADLIKDGA
jgi:predicted Zn-dependent protease